MQLSPYPYKIRDTELFEAAVKRFERKYPLAEALLQDLEHLLRTKADAAGQIHPGFTGPAFEGRIMKLHVYPRTRYFPGIWTTFEIVGPVVVRWSLGERANESV